MWIDEIVTFRTRFAIQLSETDADDYFELLLLSPTGSAFVSESSRRLREAEFIDSQFTVKKKSVELCFYFRGELSLGRRLARDRSPHAATPFRSSRPRPRRRIVTPTLPCVYANHRSETPSASQVGEDEGAEYASFDFQGKRKSGRS